MKRTPATQRTVSLLLLLTVPACGDGGSDAPPRKVTSIQTKSAHVEKLRGLSQQDRDLALRRAIQDAGQNCKRITSSQETGTYKNMTIWTAHCDRERDWAVFIAPNGAVQVRSCRHVEQLGLPVCKKGTAS